MRLASLESAWTRGCVAALVLTAAATESLPAQDLPAAARAGLAAPAALPPHPLVLLVDNLARLGDTELETAQALATTVLRTAKLEPMWLDCRRTDPEPGAVRVRVVLAADEQSERMLERLRLSRDVLALAPPGTFRVYVFCDRIRRFARRSRLSFEQTLGIVLAHEIGHHLLPGGGHTLNGIMQFDVHRAAAMPWFTAQQVNRIHALIPGPDEVPSAASLARAGGATQAPGASER